MSKHLQTDEGMYRVMHLKEALYKANYLNYTKVIFIRHPVERLVSALRWFFSRERDMTKTKVHFEPIAKKIKRLFRAGANSSMKKSDLTFKEFLSYTVISHENHHWQTYENLCQTCRIPFDIIIKYETYERNLKNILVTYGNVTEDEAKQLIPHIHESPGQSSAERSRVYMKTIPKPLRDKFYQIYKNDFEVFDYNFPW